MEEMEKMEGLIANNETQAALEAGRRIGELESFEVKEINGIPHALIPEDRALKSLEEYLDNPKTITRNPYFGEIEGFTVYFNSFKDDYSCIFYNRASRRIKGIIDHSGKDAPRWHRHEAALVILETEEWQAWQGRNENRLGHIDFVKFLQVWLHTIVEPDAADLLDSAREFSAHRNAKFDTVVPADGGNLAVSYSEEVRGATKSGTTEFPSRLKLSLKPFLAFDKRYEIDVVINWSLSREGELSFTYTMLRTQDVIEAAVLDIREEVEEKTGLKVLA